MYENILIPTDGSEVSEEAARVGINLATRYNSSVHALYVLELYKGEDPPSLMDPVIEEAESEAEKAIEEILELGRDKKIEVNGVVKKGYSIVKQILEYVEKNDIDLIVMGTHGRSGFQRFLLGSVTEKVVRSSSIPVLTVPPSGEGT